MKYPHRHLPAQLPAASPRWEPSAPWPWAQDQNPQESGRERPPFLPSHSQHPSQSFDCNGGHGSALDNNSGKSPASSETCSSHVLPPYLTVNPEQGFWDQRSPPIPRRTHVGLGCEWDMNGVALGSHCLSRPIPLDRSLLSWLFHRHLSQLSRRALIPLSQDICYLTGRSTSQAGQGMWPLFSMSSLQK